MTKIKFKKGKIINSEYLSYIKFKGDYFCMNDIDQIISQIYTEYNYPKFPIQVSNQVQQFFWIVPYKEFFGALFCIKNEHFEIINRFGNEFYGWVIF